MVLNEAKDAGLPWDRAWYKAMRVLSPEAVKGYGPSVREALSEDRELLKECEPWLRAAYEDRDVTVDEFERCSARTEKRLDRVLTPAPELAAAA